MTAAASGDPAVFRYISLAIERYLSDALFVLSEFNIINKNRIIHCHSFFHHISTS